jgi:hypothetical protein
MTDRVGNEEFPMKINNSTKHFYKHFLLNKSNLENIENTTRKTTQKILSQRSQPPITLHEKIYGSMSTRKTKPKLSILIKRKNVQNNCLKGIFKKYILGNDVVLPFNTINNQEKFNVSNKLYNMKSLSRINQSLINKENYNNRTLNKNSFNKKIIFINRKEEKKSAIYYNKNKNSFEHSLYEAININNFSNKKIKPFIKTKKDKLHKLPKKEKDKANSLFSIKKNKIIKLQENDLQNLNSKNKTEENEENEKNEKKSISSYKIIKNLLDNPDSVIYLLYQRMKKYHFDHEGNMKKLDLKRRFLEYKKDLNKLEQNARFQLFNLKKERIIGNEIKMKGKINSTNTFFNLAFIKGDY